MPDVDITASSAVAEPAIPDLAALSSEQRQSWRQTGQFPTDSHSDEPAATSTASAAEQPASTDASTPAASDAATPDKPKGKGLQTRHAQLDAEINGLQEKLRQRAELRKQLEDPAPSPVSDVSRGSSPKAPALSEVLKSPDLASDPLNEEQFFAQFPDAAYGQYQRYLTRYELLSAQQATDQQRYQQQAEQVRTERASTFTERIKQAVTATPALLEKIAASPVSQFTPLESLPKGVRPGPENMLAQEVMTSEMAPALLVHFADHPGELSDLLDKTPAEIIRAVGRLEAKLTPAAGKPGPLPKTTSSAPPPPPQVLSRASVPADDIEGALASGDFRRYKELANKRDIAARR